MAAYMYVESMKEWCFSEKSASNNMNNLTDTTRNDYKGLLFNSFHQFVKV